MEEQAQFSTAFYKQNTFIVIEGKQADSFFIIKQGKVAITREVANVGEENPVLGVGDFFGVISTMSSHSHIETAKALTDVILITVEKKQYEELIRKHSQVAMKIMTQFSKRLRYLNETLTGIALKKTAETGPNHLFEVAEYYFNQKQYSKAQYIYNRYLVHCPEGKNAAIIAKRLAKLKTMPIGTAEEFKPSDVMRTYKKDSIFFVEGEPGDELFVIQSGSVKITKIVSDNEVLLAVLKVGDIFGEMALLEGKPRAATVSAYEECKVMALSRSNFGQMIQTQSQLIARVTSLLADRIWLIYKQLANTFISNPLGRMHDALLIQLEKERVSLEGRIPYTFSFGQMELANMVGLPEAEAVPALRELLENTKISIVENKIQTATVLEIVRQAEYYRRMDRIEKSRTESREKLHAAQHTGG
jgi:CRP-like cAMP-binding protein